MKLGRSSTLEAIAISLVGLVLGGSGDRVGDPCGICEAARVVAERMSQGNM